MFAQYGNWLTESRINSVTRNSSGALCIAENLSNVKLMPKSKYGDVIEFQVLGQKKDITYCVLLSCDPDDWRTAEKEGAIDQLVRGCNCWDAV